MRPRTLPGSWEKAYLVLRKSLSGDKPQPLLIPLQGIVKNPNFDWLQAVDSWYGHYKRTEPPVYGNSEIDAVFLLGDVEEGKPTTPVVLLYPSISLGGTTVLNVLETEDGECWELMTEHESTLVRSSVDYKRHQSNSTWMRERAATGCRNVGFPTVQMLFLVMRLEGRHLELHNARLPLARA